MTYSLICMYSRSRLMWSRLLLIEMSFEQIIQNMRSKCESQYSLKLSYPILMSHIPEHFFNSRNLQRQFPLHRRAWARIPIRTMTTSLILKTFNWLYCQVIFTTKIPQQQQERQQQQQPRKEEDRKSKLLHHSIRTNHLQFLEDPRETEGRT